MITIPRLDFSKTVDNMDGAVGAENPDNDNKYQQAPTDSA
jgi:hypothetical protein